MKIYKYILIVCLLAFTAQLNAQTVFTTKTGEKYHTNSCHYLKHSKKEIMLQKAIQYGYDACKVCKPSKRVSAKISETNLLNNEVSKSSKAPLKKTTATQCTGKTKAGKRCKRKTKSASGRCYQH